MNIYLVGYRCSGKTAVGKRLSEKLKWNFTDTDRLVESRVGMRISEIVARFGWPEFRRKESDVVSELGNADRRVVATGGGVVLDSANIRKLRETGYVVWLKASVDTIHARMRQDPETGSLRPVLTDHHSLIDEIRQTLAERLPLYAGASDMAVTTDGVDVDAICETIIEKTRYLHAG